MPIDYMDEEPLVDTIMESTVNVCTSDNWVSRLNDRERHKKMEEICGTESGQRAIENKINYFRRKIRFLQEFQDETTSMDI